jgi:aryl-alcohol dehydrogenase (NADP+)
VSNESPWGISSFLNIAKNNSLDGPITIQNGYNLINRVFDNSHSEISIRENCGLLAYSPLAAGRLTGKYLNKRRPSESRFNLWPGRFSRHNTKRGEIAISKYIKLAKKYDIEPNLFAHAFVLSRPFVLSSIFGITTLNQLKDNIKSIDITLTAEILEEIQKIHQLDPNPCV